VIVDILKTNNDFEQEVVYRFRLKDGKIEVKTAKGHPGNWRDLLIDGEFIIGDKARKISMRKEPELFMQNLKFAFSGSRYRATDVK
jgi:hypothetical protein